MKGLAISRNAMGFCAVRLHYSADPDKDPLNTDPIVADKAHAWLDAQRTIYPDPNDFQREMEVSFWVSKGQRVFPNFSQEYHCRDLVYERRKVIYRAWDFGWHCPVCIIAQIDSRDRLLVLKEIIGHKETTNTFAQRVIKQCEEWFPFHAAGYEDFCDPAGQQVKSVDSEKSERRDTEVLSGLGIHPKYQYGWSRKDGRTLIHRLLGLRSDGTPGLYVDQSQAPTLSQAFLGRYVYPETREGKIRDEPDDDTHPWADVMASLRYLVIGLHGRLGLMRFAMSQSQAGKHYETTYTGYGTPKR